MKLFYAYAYGFISLTCFAGALLFINKNQFIAATVCFIASAGLGVLGAKKSIV